MLKLSEIKELIKLIDQTSVNELEIENEGSRVCIRKHKPEVAASAVVTPVYTAVAGQPQAQPAATNEVAAEHSSAESSRSTEHLSKILSPMVGTFYRASSPGSASFVNVGDKINEKSVVCIVEAMKLMNEIEAEIRGEIVEILAENGQLIEYGQPLFLVKKD
jgi:acetyl-CoA carboxylase biotin carboxyl carrier protein